MPLVLDALNGIRDQMSTEYQDKIPVATQDNFRKIGQAFTEYIPLYLEFANKLFTVFGMQIIKSASFTNKLKGFKTGGLTTQQDIQEIFINMAAAANKYNPAGPNPFGRRDPVHPSVAFHRMNRQDEYCETVGDLDFIRAFNSPESADRYAMLKLNSMYVRAEYDEWLHMKNVLATAGHTPEYALTEDTALDPEKVYYTRSGAGTTNDPYIYALVVPSQANVANIATYYEDTAIGTSHGYFDYEALDVTNEATAKGFVKTVRKAVQDVSYMSNSYNRAGVFKATQPEDLVLFLNKDVMVETDVEMLSKAFNPSKAEMNVSVISMDNFGTLPDTLGLMVEKDFFKIFDTLLRMEPGRNPQGIFTNYFYHVHQTLSSSPFATAVRFKKTAAPGG